MWTFEYQMTSTGKIVYSKQRLDTAEDAVREAYKWLEVCALNDCYVAVRVIELDKNGNKVAH